MIIRASFFVVASVAALALSSISIRSPRRPKSMVDGGNGSSSHCEEGSEEKEKQKAENRKPLDEEIQEEKQVKILSLTKELKRRKIELECRLFELYGLKEEYSYIAHLRKELTVKTAETDGLNLAIDSIQAENERLKDDIREVFLAEKQLEAAQKRANELEEKLVFNANRLKGQLEKLEGQVSRFQKSSKRCADDPAIEKKLSNFSRLELEVLEMRRKNKELELEKRELMIMLNATHSRTSNLSKTAESEVMSRVAAEASALRNSNKELLKQVERLQKQRFGMVEELVYQRWLNCCLRFEVHQKNLKRDFKMYCLGENNSSLQLGDGSTSSQTSGSDNTFIPNSSGQPEQHF
ncbi:protein CHUP1, chloroplastic-like [Punica granatum]|uniref:Protein CHUP1, chloroplastic-like n=1 Tax=Punica granatum TaxID=22663 RepID=A0A6P8EE12_PUNGR|nr:protein CHUP1, chloroplastic-like [Punica granatum]